MIHQECVGGQDNGRHPLSPILRLRESTKSVSSQQKGQQLSTPDMRADSFTATKARDLGPHLPSPIPAKMLQHPAR